MQYTQAEWLLFFFLYGFLGWVWECIYVSAYERKWVNRGFLFGSFIPIYGFGAIIVLWLTLPVRDNILLIFIFGMLGATLLEYVTGVAMQKLFHARYWDYSRNRFNINGYICPFCSFGWGVFSVVQIKVLHLFVESAILKIPTNIASLISLILVAVYSADTAISIQTAWYLREYKQTDISVKNVLINAKH